MATGKGVKQVVGFELNAGGCSVEGIKVSLLMKLLNTSLRTHLHERVSDVQTQEGKVC